MITLKKKLKKARGLILQIGILLVLFLLAVLALRHANLIKFPDFIENLISTEEDQSPEYTKKGFEIFKYIEKEDLTEDFSLYPTITVDKLNDILYSLEHYENFYWETTSEILTPGAVLKTSYKSRVSGKKYNIEQLDSAGNTIKKYVSDGLNTCVVEIDDTGVSKSVYDAGLFDLFSDASIVSIDDFKTFDFSTTESDIRLIETDERNLVSVTFQYDRSGTTIKKRYLLSLDYGVVLFAECFENDEPVYTLTTEKINSVSSFEDELFEID